MVSPLLLFPSHDNRTSVDANFIASDVVVDQEVYGCTNAAAINYNPAATVDDGTCYFNNSIKGCTDINALNYNPAEIGRASCRERV